MSKIDVEFTVPDRQPYEGKATMKQKQWLWEHGLKDQGLIDGLGKRQASAVIDQFQAAVQSHVVKQQGLVVLVWIGVGLVVVFVGWLLLRGG